MRPIRRRRGSPGDRRRSCAECSGRKARDSLRAHDPPVPLVAQRPDAVSQATLFGYQHLADLAAQHRLHRVAPQFLSRPYEAFRLRYRTRLHDRDRIACYEVVSLFIGGSFPAVLAIARRGQDHATRDPPPRPGAPATTHLSWTLTTLLAVQLVVSGVSPSAPRGTGLSACRGPPRQRTQHARVIGDPERVVLRIAESLGVTVGRCRIE